MTDAPANRLIQVVLDETSIERGTPDQDYFLVCESYYAAIRTATPSQIEAIDMGRRGLHDDGAVLLGERLKDKIICDQPTFRRLFTLITALHWKG